MRKLITVLLALSIGLSLGAQSKAPGVVIDKKVEFSKTVHDFGDVLLSDGKLQTEFTVKNLGDEALVILAVVSSCGCTQTSWTKEPITKGKSGTISAVYDNSQGPGTFDKTLTVYLSSPKSPVVLRLRGTVYKQKVALTEAYPIKNGSLGFKEEKFFMGNLTKGQTKSNEYMIANLSSSPLNLSFKGSNVKLTVEPNPIPANSTARMSVSLNPPAGDWGHSYYDITPFCNNKPLNPLKFWAFIIDDFSALSPEEFRKAPVIETESSNFNFDVVPEGKIIEAAFTIKNSGKTNLSFLKLDSDNPAAQLQGSLPVIRPGEKGEIKVKFNTKAQKKGECLVLITLVTNSPSRPYINLFITGAIK